MYQYDDGLNFLLLYYLDAVAAYGRADSVVDASEVLELVERLM
jgi:hypothetical protein